MRSSGLAYNWFWFALGMGCSCCRPLDLPPPGPTRPSVVAAIYDWSGYTSVAKCGGGRGPQLLGFRWGSLEDPQF